jgi:choline-glycine betaine transporter
VLYAAEFFTSSEAPRMHPNFKLEVFWSCVLKIFQIHIQLQQGVKQITFLALCAASPWHNQRYFL